ncbi:phosphotransferase [Lachnoclostridium sp. An181]|uniref:phosphotransferase n=1 Tax=Lachnoclostridium sp. An181 TaxID=1965575 RepID=UPI000B3A55CB|nr:phosphotransferase [Lachnoclostridium sp. An181]OUP49211.1 MarR family transcriptional regulator [Lachnoclostridium sp. An181]
MRELEQDVLERYPIDVGSTRKVRGAVLCEAREGIFLVREWMLSERRLQSMNALQEQISGEIETDAILKNREGGLLTEMDDGTRYIVKHWFAARECDIRREYELLEACRFLAKLHQVMRLSQESPFLEENLLDEYKRHNRELKKVRSFIRGRVQKGTFETAFLGCFEEMYALAEKTLERLAQSEYEELRTESIQNRWAAHGDYNYHNLLIAEGQIKVTNFERFHIGVQAADFYYFLRKTMEKTRWDKRLGDRMIQAYQSVRPLTKKEMEYLAIRLSYPEKFWKIADTYYSSNKAWIPVKSLEKLETEICQTKEKSSFLRQIFSFHL